MKTRFARWNMLIVICALLAGSVQVATSQSRFRQSRTYAQIEGIDLSATTFKDGTYTGTADGFRPGLSVEVRVKDGKVAQIAVVKHSEVGSRFYDPPVRLIPAEIVRKQSTEVDAVSGATATSYGIMAAVEDALKKATP